METSKNNVPIEEFDVIISGETEDNTVIVTSRQQIDSKLQAALEAFDPTNRKYSAYLIDGGSGETITADYVDTLADGAQNDLKKILSINAIIRKLINLDDIIGLTYESIENNINTEINLSYKEFKEKRNKTKALDNARVVIDAFNERVGLQRLLRKAIPLAYSEGNYIMYLRGDVGNYVIDYYPLGVAEISDYEINGQPVVLINIKELTARLKKTTIKNKKGKALFFETVEKEIQNNYPKEVYDAYKAGEQYAALDVERTGVIRVNNLNRKYGLSSIFKAIKPHLMLETFDTADRTNTKAKAKKIIHQVLRKEIMGQDGDRESYTEMAYAHENLMNAWKMPTVVTTTPAYVEKIIYVEPKSELTSIQTVNQYRNRVMSALGISFLNSDGTQTVSTADLSLTQLMKTINKISEQMELILKRWYRIVLTDNNIGLEYCPTVEIIDSELIEFKMKKELSEYLFTKLNSSYETAYKIVGYDIENEKQLREKENTDNLDEVFAPRLTAFTNSGKNETEKDSGRPPDEESKDPLKQDSDKVRNET